MNNDLHKRIIQVLHKENPFLLSLEEGYFNMKIFNDYVIAVSKVTDLSTEQGESREIALVVWEISYLIETLIASHYDTNDLFLIRNLDMEELYLVRRTLYYIANCCSWKKNIDLNFALIN
jgi:hypothetical protein